MKSLAVAYHTLSLESVKARKGLRGQRASPLDGLRFLTSVCPDPSRSSGNPARCTEQPCKPRESRLKSAITQLRSGADQDQH